MNYKNGICVLKTLIDTVDTVVDGIDTIMDSIYEETAKITARTASTLPQGAPGQTAYFTVSGRVLIVDIVGEVTVQIQGVAVSIKLISNPTVGADVDLCTAVVVNGDVIGTVYNITGTLANAMIATTSGAVKSQVDPIVVTAGTIDLHTDINATGETKWTVSYLPLDVGATVSVI